VEVLAAAGLILPAALDVAPVPTPPAAAGPVLLMSGAAFTRLRRHEATYMVADLVPLVLAGFVACGRSGPGSFVQPAADGARTPRVSGRGGG
jgi:hypothetical protein